MKVTYICMILLLIHSQIFHSHTNEWTFISELQERCPYTLFCDMDANLSMPAYVQDNLRPCCKPCSCSPDCLETNNCCNNTENALMHQRKCMSSMTTIAGSFTPTKDYMFYMVYMCHGHDCSENDSSIEPVYSPSNKHIFVNSYCAFCHNINDSVQWRPTISCLQFSEHSILSEVSHDLLHRNESHESDCFMSFIPPKGYDLKHLECRDKVIRQCNETGSARQKTPFWDYCPMFNATYVMSAGISFGNVFCYMCNFDDDKIIPYLCSEEEPKFQRIYLTHVLDHAVLELDTVQTTDKSQIGHCGSDEVLIQSFATECRKLECPWGQFRLQDKCDFYSKEWIGDKFSVLLKLTPVNQVTEFPINLLTNKSFMLRYDKRCRLLKRKAMKQWYIKLLYHPTNDLQFVQFIVVIATHPSTSVQPNLLKRTIGTSLKEIWVISDERVMIRLKVNINEHQSYEKFTESMYSNLSNYPVAFTRAMWGVEDHVFVDKEDYLIPISMVVRDEFIDIINLSKLFFCHQVALREDEYILYRHYNRLKFVVTNKTLYDNEFRIARSDDIYLCIDEFPVSKCLHNEYRFRSYNLLGVALLVRVLWHYCVRINFD